MSLTLTIENMQSLPDGGPLSFRLAGARGADIGRDSHLDWSLPDPSRFISGKHCEIRFRDGGYWLSDVSTNGTFLNGGDRRMQSPHKLRQGDRLLIGQYIVAVDVESVGAAAPEPAAFMPEPNASEDLWGGVQGAAPPVDPREFRPPSQNRPVKPDFLEWAVDVPNSPGVGFVARPVAPPAEAPRALEPEPLDWAAGGLPAAPPPEPVSAVPTPRRAVWSEPTPAQPPRTGRGVEASPPAPPRERTQGSPFVAVDVQPPADFSAAPAPRPMPASPVADHGRPAVTSDVMRSFARGAGLPPEALVSGDANAFAEHLGRLMRIVADNLRQLLAGRSQTKRIARSANQTMIQATDNNPLKFSPSGPEALRIMFGPRTGSYLDADRALQQSFDDLKGHQIKTFSAMQQALQSLLEDLDPKAIEEGVGKEQGLSAVLGSRKARLWDLYEQRWKTKTGGREGGQLELFLRYFSEAYDRDIGPGHS